MSAWSLSDMPDLGGRVAVVTGANTGIGFETAAALANHRASVILACRNRRKAEAAMARIRAGSKTPPDLEFIELDLANLASVERFAARLLAERDRLDLLINNAGVMIPPLTRTEDGFELQFGCNHLGHFALTGRLWPALTATPGSRVVTVSSIAHRLATMDFADLNAEADYDAMGAYRQSKLANLLFTFELDRRARASGSTVAVLAAHPGWTATDIQRHSAFARFLSIFFAQATDRGALPTLRAAVDPEAESGDYYGPRGPSEMRGAPVKVGTTPDARNEDDARRLWTISEELTGVHFPGKR